MPFTEEELRELRPHVTDRQSLRCYLEMDFRLEEDRPYYRLYAPGGSFYATVDRAMAEWLLRDLARQSV